MYVEEKRAGEVQDEPLTQVQKDLLAAAAYLQVHGWGTDVLYNPKNGQVCLLGAIRGAIAGFPTRVGNYEEENRIGRCTVEVELIIGTQIPFWNDRNCKCQEVAIATLKEAAQPYYPTPATTRG